METVLIILAVICVVVGILGSILPALPGPPVSFLGMLLMYWSGTTDFTYTFLGVWLAVTVAVTILDYLIPPYLARITGGSKSAARGSLIGMVAGLFFTPAGMLVGMLAGAFIGELASHRSDSRDFGKALRVSLGSLLGFLLGTGIKLIAAGFMFYYVIRALF